MRKLFAIIFGIGLLFAISLIISLIPINKVGQKVSQYANKYNIKLSSTTSWNFRLFGFQATTGNFNVEAKIGDNKTLIEGKGEDFVYSFITDKVSISNLNVEVFLNEQTTINDIIEAVKKEIDKSTYYAFIIDNIVITIYKKYKKDEDYKIYDEIMLSNIEFVKKKRKANYNVDISINKNKSMKIFASTDNLGTEFYDINAKISSDNLTCYFYDAKNKGEMKCNVKNLYELSKDFGANIEDGLYKKMLNKKITLNANITHSDDNFTISGRTNINKDNGEVVYNSKDNLIELKFDKIDFDSEESDINDTNEDEQEEEEMDRNAQKMAMSGKENKIINSVSQKQQKLNINCLNKIAILILKCAKSFGFNLKSNIKQAVFNDIPIKNIVIDIEKPIDIQKIDINEFSMSFGSKKSTKFTSTDEGLTPNLDSFDNILIKYEQGRIGNLFISGSNVAGLTKLFRLENINPEFESGKYFLTGDLKLSTNEILLDNVILNADDKNVFIYDSDTKYNFDKNSIEREQSVKISNLKMEEYFNFKNIYKNIYADFVNFQADNKQDAIFWKKLFDKHNSNDNIAEYKTAITINNSSYYSENITNFALISEDKKLFNKLNIISQSDFVNGEFDIDIRNVEGKETINANIKSSFIRLPSFNTIFADFELATGKKVNDVFFANQDYNIPSFVGLNGLIAVDANNVILNANKTISSIWSKIYLKDGVFEAKDTQVKYGDGHITANVNFTLQNIPDFQIGLSVSGLNIDDIIDTPLDGYVSAQCSFHSRGFNPYLFIHDMNGKCAMVVQNLYIPKFDLLNTSNYIISHGLQKSYNYGSMISKNSLAFSQGNGNLLLDKGILKGDIAMSRELISGSAEFEYSFDTGLLNKLAGSFVMMMAREKLETPFPIYIPVACNGKPEDPECLINWQQFEEVLNSK